MSEDRKRLVSQLNSQADLQLSGWGQSTFARCTHSNANHIQKHPHRHTQNNLFPNIWAPSNWHIKLTITRPLTTHPILAFCWPPWITFVLCCSTWLLWELCLPESPSLHGSRIELANRGTWMRLGKRMGSHSHCSPKDITVACSDGWSQRCLMGSGTSSFSFALHAALLPTYWPCWPTAAPAPPSCHQLTCWFTEAGATHNCTSSPSRPSVSNWMFPTSQINWSVIPLVLTSPAPLTIVEGLIPTICPLRCTTHGGSAPLTILDWYTSLILLFWTYSWNDSLRTVQILPTEWHSIMMKTPVLEPEKSEAQLHNSGSCVALGKWSKLSEPQFPYL